MNSGIAAVRVIRGAIGVFLAIQMLLMLPVIEWILHPQLITGKMLAFFVAKMVFVIPAAIAFHLMRKQINKLHAADTGEILLKKWSSL